VCNQKLALPRHCCVSGVFVGLCIVALGLFVHPLPTEFVPCPSLHANGGRADRGFVPPPLCRGPYLPKTAPHLQPLQIFNQKICSSKCRDAKKVPQKCEHGRRPRACKDCGTAYCEHRRQRDRCKECGTCHCQHGRKKGQCRDCGTGHCEHGRQKAQCKDCGTGHCEHGRQRGRCEEC
jgi:hypothetical protein